MVIYVRDESGVLQALKIPAYKGDKGEAGITPNIQIGDVITLESGQQATVVRRGDDENPIFDFAIPKGEDGKDGVYVGSIDDAPDYAQIVINDDPSPYDLFYEDANVSYMGDTYTSLKEKADADIEYLLRKFGTQHYEGTNIVATDTYAKQVKSAILKGDTLVNLTSLNENYYKHSNITSLEIENNYLKFTTKEVRGVIFDKTPSIKPNTKYFVIVDVKSNPFEFSLDGYDTNSNQPNTTKVLTYNSGEVGIKTCIITTGNSINYNKGIFRIWTPLCSKPEILIIRFMILEYQDGMGNWDIPYFEGMKSVKSPSLVSVGKNQWIEQDFMKHTSNSSVLTNTDNGFIVEHPNQISEFIKTYINLKKGTWTISFDVKKIDTSSAWVYLQKGDVYGENITSYILIRNGRCSITYTSSSDIENACFFFDLRHQGIVIISNIQLEQGSTATAYQPYKSHTLTTPQDLTLRGIGDVQDTLDLSICEKVERIGEIVLNGSEGEKWSRNSTLSTGYETSYFTYKLSDSIRGNAGEITKISDWLQSLGDRNHLMDKEGITCVNDGDFSIRILKTKLESDDVAGLKKLLSVKNLHCQYILKEKAIKTVDLKGQKVYSYDGITHYITSSLDGQPSPILSIDVPTNTTKMIARQRKEIEQQEQQLQEQEEVQNVLIESQLAWYEQSLSTLDLPNEEPIPLHIQKLYELSRKYKIEGE